MIDKNLIRLHHEGVFRILMTISLVAILTFVLLSTLAGYYEVSYRTLTGDPNTLSEQPFYTGILSQLGVFVWAGTAAVAFAWAHLNAHLQKSVQVTRFFVGMGLIVLMLAIDDSFLLHEDVLPNAGIPQKVVVFIYGLAVIALLITYRALIVKTPFLLLLFAFGGFAISVFIDFFIHSADQHSYLGSLIEDGAKFIGIAFWLSYVYKSRRLVL